MEIGGDSKAPPAYSHGHHWVSPFNFESAVQEGLSFAQPLTVFDGTLRKILYTAGLRPTVDGMLRVAEALQDIGIRESFFNIHWWGDDSPNELEFEICRAILSRGFAFRMAISPDAVRTSPGHGGQGQSVSARQAIDTLRDIGMDTMNVTLGDPGEAGERTRQLELLAELFSYAQSQSINCTLSLADVGRRDFDYLLRTGAEGVRLGGACINLVDSCSSLSPDAMKFFVGAFKSRLPVPVPLVVHVHNDFGLACATAIAAATAGAHPEVAVNGLSYRSGFPALEEVVLSLELLYGVRTGLRVEGLQHLSNVVAEETGLPIHPLKPVTGAHQFLRDLPMWMLPHLRNGPDVFPTPASCYSPSSIGAQVRMVWGNHLSTSLIQAKLVQMGLGATPIQVQEIRRRLETALQAMDSYPRWLTEAEVEEICNVVVAH